MKAKGQRVKIREELVKKVFAPSTVAGTLDIGKPRKRFRIISVDEVVVEEQIRKDMNPDKLEELARSIESEGLIHPIVVSELPDGRYKLEAGHRRFTAIKDILKRDTVEAIILPEPPKDRTLLQLYENIHRENLHPVEVAEAVGKVARELHQQMGFEESYEDFIKKHRFFILSRYHKDRLDDKAKEFIKNLSQKVNLNEMKTALCLYLDLVAGEHREELRNIDFNFTTLKVLADRGIRTEPELLKWLRIAVEKQLSTRQLSQEIALSKGREAQKPSKDRDKKMVEKVVRFYTSIKRSRAVKKNPELRRQIIEHLKRLIAELEEEPTGE